MNYIKDYKLENDGTLIMYIDNVEYMRFNNVDSMYEAQLLIAEENTKLIANHVSETNKRYHVLNVLTLVKEFTPEDIVTEKELMDESVSIDDLLTLVEALSSLRQLKDIIKMRNIAVDFVSELKTINLN